MNANPSHLTRFQRFLCYFRAVAPEHVAKHPCESANLRVQVIAMLLPIGIAMVNGWLLAASLGIGPFGRLLTSVMVGLLIYGVELVLINLSGQGGWRSIPAIAIRATIALCLAVLLGESITSGILFKDSLADFYRQAAERELSVAAQVREASQDAAEELRKERMAPFLAEVERCADAISVARLERQEAQNGLQRAKELILDEEESRAVSATGGRGSRFKEKEATYHQPALLRLDSANTKLKSEEASLAAAQIRLQDALTAASPADERLAAAKKDYARKAKNTGDQPHHDLGSRCTALMELAKQRPIIGFFYLLAVTFFVCVDLGLVLLKTLGRTRAFDLEEIHSLEMTHLRLEEETACFLKDLPQIAQIRREAVLRGVVSQTAMTSALESIREARRYQEAVADERQAVVESYQTAHAHNRTDLMDLCRNTLDTIEFWTEHGLRRSTKIEEARIGSQ